MPQILQGFEMRFFVVLKLFRPARANILGQVLRCEIESLEIRIVFRGQRIGPDKTRGVDIGVQTALKPMQLIGPDEVHLARQHSVVPSIRQVMRKCRDKAVVGVPIVIAPGRRGIEPRHETGPRGHADWAGGGGMGEIRRACSKLCHIRV